MANFKNPFGFSLIELIMTIALLGIVFIIGGYAFERVIPKIRLEGTANTLIFDLHLARMRAIGQNCLYRIQVDPARKQYFIERESITGSSRWSGVPEGIIRKLDDPKNPYYSPGVDLVCSSNNLVFLPRGNVVGTTIILKNKAGKKKITLSSQGRVKVQEG
jgi:prepilin-type N-terminal cleavage/methylation domain-containing protein